jgi:hypothetical protein
MKTKGPLNLEGGGDPLGVEKREREREFCVVIYGRNSDPGVREVTRR